MYKEAYHTLCQTEDTIPIFSQDWWLDVVCGKAGWDVHLIEQRSRILAALPYYMPHPGIILMPPYTQTMGIWFAPYTTDTKYTSAIEQRQAISKLLIDTLKKHRCFRQHFHHTYTDWLPFYWNNYTQTTRYTYILTHLNDFERLWLNMSQHMRRNIKKAREQYRIVVKKGIPVEELLKVQAQTFERQGVKNNQSPNVLKELIDVCRQREQGDVWGGYDEEGNLHAAVFVVWQKKVAYYLAGGGNPLLRHSGAHSLVLWEAIREVAVYSDSFDFEGSMLPGVERFFREFGGVQTPYFAINKGNLSLIDKVLIRLHSK